MIDWINPSDDILEAKRVGYQNGLAEKEDEIAGLESEIEDLLAACKAVKALNYSKDTYLTAKQVIDQLDRAIAKVEGSK